MEVPMLLSIALAYLAGLATFPLILWILGLGDAAAQRAQLAQHAHTASLRRAYWSAAEHGKEQRAPTARGATPTAAPAPAGRVVE